MSRKRIDGAPKQGARSVRPICAIICSLHPAIVQEDRRSSLGALGVPGNVVHSLFPLTSLLGDMLQLCLLLPRATRELFKQSCLAGSSVGFFCSSIQPTLHVILNEFQIGTALLKLRRYLKHLYVYDHYSHFIKRHN